MTLRKLKCRFDSYWEHKIKNSVLCGAFLFYHRNRTGEGSGEHFGLPRRKDSENRGFPMSEIAKRPTGSTRIQNTPRFFRRGGESGILPLSNFLNEI